jgi:hypothetical protein
MTLGQITPQGNPIARHAVIVLPDHDRLRVLAMAAMHQAGGPAVEFNSEERRLRLHLIADVVARSGVFGSASIIEQNDTAAALIHPTLEPSAGKRRVGATPVAHLSTRPRSITRAKASAAPR